MTPTLQQLIAEKCEEFDAKFPVLADIGDFHYANLLIRRDGKETIKEADTLKLNAVKSFLSTSLREIAESAIAAVRVEEFVPPIKFEPDYTTKAWNECRAESHSRAEEFLKGGEGKDGDL